MSKEMRIQLKIAIGLIEDLLFMINEHWDYLPEEEVRTEADKELKEFEENYAKLLSKNNLSFNEEGRLIYGDEDEL
jgi:hypothetical protein